MPIALLTTLGATLWSLGSCFAPSNQSMPTNIKVLANFVFIAVFGNYVAALFSVAPIKPLSFFALVQPLILIQRLYLSLALFHGTLWVLGFGNSERSTKMNEEAIKYSTPILGLIFVVLLHSPSSWLKLVSFAAALSATCFCMVSAVLLVDAALEIEEVVQNSPNTRARITHSFIAAALVGNSARLHFQLITSPVSTPAMLAAVGTSLLGFLSIRFNSTPNLCGIAAALNWVPYALLSAGTLRTSNWIVVVVVSLFMMARVLLYNTSPTCKNGKESAFSPEELNLLMFFGACHLFANSRELSCPWQGAISASLTVGVCNWMMIAPAVGPIMMPQRSFS